MTIWTKLKNLFSKPKQTMTEAREPAADQSTDASLNQEQLVDLLHRLERTIENAYSCEEVYALLDEYVELVADDEEAKKLMPLVQNHLDMCPDCRDEYEILLHVLKTADS